jgi:hypothetical protein
LNRPLQKNVKLIPIGSYEYIITVEHFYHSRGLSPQPF